MRADDVVRRYRDAAVVRAADAAERLGPNASARELTSFEEALDDADRYSRLASMAPLLDVLPGDEYANGGFFSDLLHARDDPLARQRLTERTWRAADHYGAEARSGDVLGGFLVPGFERRAASMSTLAGLVGASGFSPEAAGGVPLPGRPVLDLIVNGFPTELPATGATMTVAVAATAGITAAAQTAENTAVGESTPLVFTNVEVPIVTVACRVDMSRQAFERRTAAADAHIAATVMEALNSEQERQLFAGSGSSGQMTGLLNSAISMVTCATASAVVVTQKSLEAARVGSAFRRRPSRIVAMTPQRAYWLGAQTAGSSQPMPLDVLQRANLAPVFSDGIPSTVSSNQDRVLVLAPGDIAYAEGPPRVTVAANPLAGSNTVQLVAYRYAAMAVRYPTAVGCVSGTGLLAPSVL